MRKYLLLILLFLSLSGCSVATPTITDTGEPGSIKALIFFDANHNGVLDTGEQGVAGRIMLSQQLSCPPSDATKITRQPTEPDGWAVFSNLKPGKYCVGADVNVAATTRGVLEAYLSSKQEAQVSFGLADMP